jgi:parallel beta-helix repeat protein
VSKYSKTPPLKPFKGESSQTVVTGGGVSSKSVSVTKAKGSPKFDKKMPAEVTFMFAEGRDAIMKIGRLPMSANGYAIGISGIGVTFVRPPSVSADIAAVRLSGKATSLTRTRLLAAAKATFTETGVAATVSKSRLFAAAASSYALAGKDVTMSTSIPNPSEVFFAPSAVGTGTGSSFATAKPLSNTAINDALAAGATTITIRADAGDVYSLTAPLTIVHTAAGFANVRFIQSSGAAADNTAWLEGNRQAWSPPVDLETTTDVTGWDGNTTTSYSMINLVNGNLAFSGLRFRNVTGNCYSVAAPVDNVTINDNYAYNVRRFLHDGSAGATNLTVNRLNALGFSGRLFRLGSANTSNVTIAGPGVLDSRRQDADPDIVRGVAILAGQNYTVRDMEFARGSYTQGGNQSAYWNGDGLSVEDGVAGVTVINCVSHGFTDGGFDIKSGGTYANLNSYDNGVNYRGHHTDITWTNPISGQPKIRGGNGREAHFGAYGLGAQTANITVSNATVTGGSTLAYYGTGSTAGTVKITFNNGTISDQVIYEYAEASVSNSTNKGYLTTFNPPIDTPDPFFDNVVLLAGFDGTEGTTAYIEESPLKVNTTFQSAAFITQTQRQYGPGSLRAGNTASYGRALYVEPTLDAYKIRTTDATPFTIEMAVMFDNVLAPSSVRYLLSQGVWSTTAATSPAQAGNTRVWSIVHRTVSTVGQLQFQYSANGQVAANRTIHANTHQLSNGVWYNLAVDFDGATLRTYFGGATTNSISAATMGSWLYSAGSPVTVGNFNGGFGTSCFEGYIDEVRITKGKARYANAVGYTLPTKRFSRTNALPNVTSVALSSTTPTVGQTLTATPTVADSSSYTLSYQWKRAGVAISGANTGTYIATANDEGSVLSCTVTATNSKGSTNATSSNTSMCIYGSAVYVSPTGNDSTGTGSAAAPYATITKAASTISSGVGAVIYVRAGTYSPTSGINFGKSGVAGITTKLLAYPGETPIIDGTNTSSGTTLLTISGSYVLCRGFEVRNSKKTGISLFDTTGTTVLNCKIHDCTRGGLYTTGSTNTSSNNNVFDGNQVYHCVQENSSRTASSGWAQAVGAYASDNLIVQNCLVYENYGEGIGMQSTLNAQILNNNTHDNYSVNIYLDNAQGAQVHTNRVYNTGNTSYYRNSAPAYCIRLANEVVARPLPSQDIVVTNNIIGGTSGPTNEPIGYSTFGANTGMVNCTLTPNQIYADATQAYP